MFKKYRDIILNIDSKSKSRITNVIQDHRSRLEQLNDSISGAKSLAIYDVSAYFPKEKSVDLNDIFVIY